MMLNRIWEEAKLAKKLNFIIIFNIIIYVKAYYNNVGGFIYYVENDLSFN